MTYGEPRIPDRRPGFIGAFRFKDFRLLWAGLLVSNLGTWMQFTALGYYVAAMAPNAAVGALDIGLLGAARAVPVLLLSPFAGVVADRYPRRLILFLTNGATSALSFVLFALVATNHAPLWTLMITSGAAGGHAVVRRARAPELGAADGAARVRRRRDRAELGRVQRAERRRPAARGPADRGRSASRSAFS